MQPTSTSGASGLLLPSFRRPIDGTNGIPDSPLLSLITAIGGLPLVPLTVAAGRSIAGGDGEEGRMEIKRERTLSRVVLAIVIYLGR